MMGLGESKIWLMLWEGASGRAGRQRGRRSVREPEEELSAGIRSIKIGHGIQENITTVVTQQWLLSNKKYKKSLPLNLCKKYTQDPSRRRTNSPPPPRNLNIKKVVRRTSDNGSLGEQTTVGIPEAASQCQKISRAGGDCDSMQFRGYLNVRQWRLMELYIMCKTEPPPHFQPPPPPPPSSNPPLFLLTPPSHSAEPQNRDL